MEHNTELHKTKRHLTQETWAEESHIEPLEISL